MGLVSGPKPQIPRPTGWKIPGALTRHVVLDPGLAYTAADTLLFLGTNIVGAVSMVSAIAIATALKTISVLQPQFLDKHPRIKELANDDRVPLRAGGLAMLLVTGATLATGAWLPAAASFFFAIANFGLAESASKKHIDAENEKAAAHKTQSMTEKAVALLKRPDIYLNVGFGLAGLMAGGASMMILPLVGAAFVLGAKNTMQGKPEYAGHPKLLTATAAVLFAGIGVATGHGLIAAAHLINGIALGEMERRMTPGGLPQILRDIKGSVTGAMGALFGRKPAAPVAAPMIPVPDMPIPVASAPLPPRNTLQQAFEPVATEVTVVSFPVHQPTPQEAARRAKIAGFDKAA